MAARKASTTPTRALAALTCAGVMALGAPSLPAAQAETTHTLAQAACTQVLAPKVKDDRSAPGKWLDPSSLVFGLGDAAKGRSPQQVGPIKPGTVWMIGSTQQPGVPWLGANTQHPSLLEKTSGEVNWELTGFEGPGSMAVYTQSNFGGIGDLWFQASGNTPDAQHNAHSIPPNTHVHPSWMFDKPGTYKVTIRQTTTAKNGTALSGESTLTFNVGGKGNADDGHFDFGAAVECGTPAAAATPSAAGNGQAEPGKLETEGTFGWTDHSSGLSLEGKFGSSGRPPFAATAASRNVVAAPAPVATGGASAGAGDAKCAPGIKPMVKDDRSVPAQWKDPATMVFGLGDAAKADLPQAVGPVPAGPVWMIGSTQQSGVPWLGANTQHPSLLENTTGDVVYEISKFEGPGAMVVFTQGGLGQIVGEEWFRANDGKAQGSHTIPANSHVHPSWVFSKPGTYNVTIKQTTTSKDGDKLSGEATLTFNVGGAGNADEGHFDFGATFDAQGSCSGGAAPAGGAAAGNGAAAGSDAAAGGTTASSGGSAADASGATRSGELAETGTTVMTLPFAVLGLGILVFGGGVVALDTRLRNRILGAAGLSK